jgi:hypothetical protein
MIFTSESGLTDPSRIADLKVWLDRLEPHWRNQPKMTFVEAQALWETEQRRA